MKLNHGYNYTFIGPNTDIQQKVPQHQYLDSFTSLDSLQLSSKSNIIIVSGGREVIFQQVEKYKERIKAIISRGVGMDNFGNTKAIQNLGILTGNNPGHSQYNTFLHSLGFLYKACEILSISSLEQLRQKQILVIGRGTISQTLCYFLSLLGITNIEKVSSLNITSTLFEGKDIIFLCTSLQSENIHIVNQEVLSKFNGVLINTSRDRIVDENTIFNKLLKREMSYITDVYGSLLGSVDLPYLVKTSHVGGRSSDIDFVISSLISNLQLILQGTQVEHPQINFSQITQTFSEQDLQQLNFSLLEDIYNKKIVQGRTIDSGVLGKIKAQFG